MGFIAADINVQSVDILKETLQPFTDNDFIRNSIYNYLEVNPEKKVVLK